MSTAQRLTVWGCWRLAELGLGLGLGLGRGLRISLLHFLK